MKTALDWDYTRLADAYVHRPAYAAEAIDALVNTASLVPGMPVVDLGAGTGHLTVELASRELQVTAVEPNDRMRYHGERRTQRTSNVSWIDALMQDTGLGDQRFALTSYGSCFGVADPQMTLRESARLLRPSGWFACMWNHRQLDDPLQARIEAFIQGSIDDYRYGSRREDQGAQIDASGLFGEVRRIEAPVMHTVGVDAWMEAWYSHATLQRQAGERFTQIVEGIGRIVAQDAADQITVPYTTRMWMAQLAPR
ncbi:MAG: class I SAM-dependent methyltransferase [Pseudomonadota bacterium]